MPPGYFPAVNRDQADARGDALLAQSHTPVLPVGRPELIVSSDESRSIEGLGWKNQAHRISVHSGDFGQI